MRLQLWQKALSKKGIVLFCPFITKGKGLDEKGGATVEGDAGGESW